MNTERHHLVCFSSVLTISMSLNQDDEPSAMKTVVGRIAGVSTGVHFVHKVRISIQATHFL